MFNYSYFQLIKLRKLALVINKSTSPDLYIVLVPTLWLVKMYEAKGWRAPVHVQISLPFVPNSFKF